MNTIPQNLPILTTETRFLYPGPAGDLEVMVSAAPANCQGIALICHPHPLYGGTMTNKVVTTLSKSFLECQMQTLRFNFRGVGESGGSYANGEGEADDLKTLVEWVEKANPYPQHGKPTQIWLAGFSFGSYVAMQLAQSQVFSGLVTIAPPVNHFDFQENIQLSCPWILVQGEDDDVVPSREVYAWVEKLKIKPELIRIEGAGHFFHGKLGELKGLLVDSIASRR